MKVKVTRKNRASEKEAGAETCCSLDEELQIVKTIKNGGEERNVAIERLSQLRSRLVVAVAKRYARGALSIDEPIAAANRGLLLAAKNFDESKGFRFMSYAVWWVRKSIENEMEEFYAAVK